MPRYARFCVSTRPMSSWWHDVIRASDVTVAYGAGAERVQALRGVSVSFAASQVACIKGPSGSGKSTLLSVLAGLRRPTSGEVWIHDRRLDTLAPSALAEIRRTSIGIVFQNFRLLRSLTVHDNLRVAATISGIPAQEHSTRIREALAAVHLTGKERRQLWQMSGGEKQRVAIARAVLSRPAVLLADEPTTALDKATALECLSLLRSLAADVNCAVVVVTHDPRVANRCDVVWRLEDGIMSEVSDDANDH